MLFPGQSTLTHDTDSSSLRTDFPSFKFNYGPTKIDCCPVDRKMEGVLVLAWRGGHSYLFKTSHSF